MMMRCDDQPGDRRLGPAAVLRREACSERPPFSEAFHDRLMRRLPNSPGSRQTPLSVAPVAAPPGLIRRAMLPGSISAAVVSVAFLLVARSGLLSRADRASRTVAGGEAERAPPAMLAGGVQGELTIGQEQESVGIDRLPMFAEIEESLREGVTTLAASLLEVPEWTALADFDAGGLGGDEGR